MTPTMPQSPELSLGDRAVLAIIDRCVDKLKTQVLESDFGKFWSEHDITAYHWSQLQRELVGHEVEVHTQLRVAGTTPDVVVIPKSHDP